MIGAARDGLRTKVLNCLNNLWEDTRFMWYKGLNKMDIALIADHILDEEDNVRGTADSFCENPLLAENKTLLEQIDWESYMWGSFHQSGASNSTPQRDTYASSSAPPSGKVATDNNMSSLVGGLVSILKQKSAGNSGAGQGHAHVSTHSLDHQDDETARETLANMLVTHFNVVRRRIMENNTTPRESIDEDSDVTPTGTLSDDAVMTLSFPKDARTPFGKFLKKVVNSVTAGTSEEWQQVRTSLALLGLGSGGMGATRKAQRILLSKSLFVCSTTITQATAKMTLATTSYSRTTLKKEKIQPPYITAT